MDMLNSKQRAALRSIASQTDAIFQIGKGGVNEAMCKSLTDALEARELIKISVLENASETAKDFANEIAEATGAEVVAVIGRKIVLFKETEKPEHRKISVQL